MGWGGGSVRLNIGFFFGGIEHDLIIFFPRNQLRVNIDRLYISIPREYYTIMISYGILSFIIGFSYCKFATTLRQTKLSTFPLAEDYDDFLKITDQPINIVSLGYVGSFRPPTLSTTTAMMPLLRRRSSSTSPLCLTSLLIDHQQ